MASPAARFPEPTPDLHITVATWLAGREINRVHPSKYGSIDFNASGAGHARFSPIADAAGKTIPTLYGGSSFECAAMETVFHDVPYSPGFKSYDRNKLAGQMASVIRPTRNLTLVNLSSTALRKLGISPTDLTASGAADYPNTRPWAVALHEQCRKADGIIWVSRQDDEARALVLFGDRVKSGDLDEVRAPADLVDNPVLYERLLALAQRIGVDIL